MKIQKITRQHRRDFWAIYECEGCGATENGEGYDDAYFHQNVVPKMVCKACGKNTEETGVEFRPLTTKYPEGFQV